MFYWRQYDLIIQRYWGLCPSRNNRIIWLHYNSWYYWK